ncbi:MAG: carboxymuconolactone decarboxylase, partial [Solidesulfovibrio sp.]|nr:carboxymuconolactone decarboxylase [Solidesulfovibrio sp.]
MTRIRLLGPLAVLALALTATAALGGDTMNDRYTRGWRALTALAPEKAQAVQDGLADIAPDMAGFSLDFSYGDVIARTVLTPAQKEIAMLAAATARGTMAPQLK